MTDEQKCFYCQGQEGRLELARILRVTEAPETPERPAPLLDAHGGYSVTGLACAMMTMAVWVREAGRWEETRSGEEWREPRWHYCHPEDFSKIPDFLRDPETGRILGEITASEDVMENLQDEGIILGQGQCPEWVMRPLGAGGDSSQPPRAIMLNLGALTGEQARIAGSARTLDDLGFRKAALLLEAMPELIGECECP